MILAALVPLLAAADPLYVAATSLNLRSEAKPTAKLVYVARIAEACTPKGAALKGWLELDCGQFHGFAKSDFLTPEKPTLEAAEKRFGELAGKDDRASWDERFTAAQRSIALGASGASYAPFVQEYWSAMQRLLDGEAQPVKTITPYIRPQTQDADSEGQTWIEGELGMSATGRAFGRVLPDGTAWFYSGQWIASKSLTWTSYFQYHAVVSPGFAAALGGKVQADACPMTGTPLLLCSANPEKPCPAVATCHTCKLGCASTCNDCRLGCKLASKRKQKDWYADGPWETCVKACLPTYATCAAACDATMASACN